VYVNNTGTFTMKGGAVVVVDPGNNDVFLNGVTVINADGTLTGASPVARITVPDVDYPGLTPGTTGRLVLFGTLANHDKFTVTPYVGGYTWFVNSSGRLETQ
jgi:hypothetical protein